MMSRISNQNLLARAQSRQSSSLSASQLALDGLQEGFYSHLGDTSSLFSMAIAGSVARSIGSWAQVAGRPAAAVFSQALSLGAESATFELLQRHFHPELAAASFFKNCQSHFIQFSVLRIVGLTGSRTNPFLRLSLESSGIVLGHRLAIAAELEAADEKGLAEAWMEASVFALQNRFSFAALHTLSGNRLSLVERNWEFQRQSAVFSASRRFKRETAASLQMAAGDWRAERKARQQALMEAEDPRAYFRRVEGVLNVVHSEEDLATWVRIRTEIEARRAERAIPAAKTSLPIGVSIFIRDGAGRVLMTYDRRSVSRRPRIPSESVEMDDGSIEEAMLRGIREELGCSARLVGRVAQQSVQFFIGDIPQNRRHYYLLEAELTGPIRLPAGGEIAAVEYATPERHFHFSAEGLYAPLDAALNGLWRVYAQEYPRRR